MDENSLVNRLLKENNSIFDYFSYIILLRDSTYTIQWANKSASAYFNITQTALQGKKCFSILQHMKQPCKNCHVQKSLISGKPEKTELPVRDGRLWEVVGLPLQYDKFSGVFIVIREMSSGQMTGDEYRVRYDLFKQLVENLREILFIRSKERYLYISPSFEGIWGLSREILYKDSTALLRTMHPDDRQRIITDYQMNKFESYETIQEEYRIIRPDGKERWISIRTLPIRDEGGNLINRIGIGEDITEPKIIEIERQERERYLHKIFNEMPFPVELIDKDGTVIMVNKAFLDTYKISSADLITGKVNAFKEPVAKSLGIPQYIKQALEGKTVYIPEIRVPVRKIEKKYGVKADDDVICELTIFPIYLKKDEPAGVVSIRKNITSEVRANQRVKMLSSAIEQAKDGVAITDLKGTIIYMNEVVNTLYGNSGNDPARTSIMHLHMKGKEKHGDIMNMVREKGKWEDEIEVKSNTGPAINLHVTITNLKDNSGNPIYYLVIIRDVTQIVQNRKELERKNIALKELLAQIELDKKEIREQVQANVEQFIIPGLERLIQKISADGELKKTVETIKESCKHICSSFARNLSRSLLKLSPREIELCNMIKQGLTNKEIARMLSLSILTIEKHRYSIRKKLGLVNKDINLYTYLTNL